MLMDGFFLVEEYCPPGPVERDIHGDDLALPVRDRRPVDPGFVLSWREYPPKGAPVVRRGIVLGLAPPAKSVWVVPDDPRAGDGYAVLVREVTADNAADAVRRVGGSGDFMSSARWQAPRQLPRAWLRTDVVEPADGREVWPVTHLHARADCTAPTPWVGVRVRRGEPVAVDGCYVFDGFLHPASVRPVRPDAKTTRHDPYVAPAADRDGRACRPGSAGGGLHHTGGGRCPRGPDVCVCPAVGRDVPALALAVQPGCDTRVEPPPGRPVSGVQPNPGGVPESGVVAELDGAAGRHPDHHTGRGGATAGHGIRRHPAGQPASRWPPGGLPHRPARRPPTLTR
jgi:hypothetical protein